MLLVGNALDEEAVPVGCVEVPAVSVDRREGVHGAGGGESREEGGLRAHVGREGGSTVGLLRVGVRRAGKREGGGKERPRDLEARMRRTGP